MAYENFFQVVPNTNSFFDEGPSIRPSMAAAVNTSSIDTVAIDGYRQGVELTQVKHFDAGIAKIHAGEPGHILRRNHYGQSNILRAATDSFKELDYFDPVEFISAQERSDELALDSITFPIVTGDNDQLENYVFDGVIEPLLIREIASFFSIEAPFYSRVVRGTLMGGNTDQTWSSDQILSVDNFEPNIEPIGYLDMVDMIDGQIPLNGYFRFDKAVRVPFNDARYTRNVMPSSSYDSTMEAALSLMSGSTDNYVSFKQRSATSGWTFENNAAVGTDSIAFGGMTH